MTALLAYAAFAYLANLAHTAVALATTLLTDPNLLDTVSWGLILGVVTPLATAVVQQPKWSTRTKTIVGVLVSIAVGVLTCLANGSLGDAKTVLAAVAVVLVSAQATYHGLWKPSTIAPAIENVTSPGTNVGDGDARHAA